MNDYTIKLTGKFSIPEPLEIDKSYEFTMSGAVVQMTKSSLENGGFEFSHTIKPEYGEVTKETGEVLKVKKRGSQSQKLRADILSLGLDYEQTMAGIIDRLEEILPIINTGISDEAQASA